MTDSDLIIKSRERGAVTRVEVARSFSFKLNCANHGGAPYESQDFFCSEKAECDIDDASDVSEMLYQFCKSEVRRAVRECIAELQRRRVA